MLKDSDKYVQLPYCVDCGSFVREYKVTVQRLEVEYCHVSIDTYDAQTKGGKTKKLLMLESEAHNSEYLESEELNDKKCVLCHKDITFLAVEPDLAQTILEHMEQTNNFFHVDIAECPDELDAASSEDDGIKQAQQLRKEILKALL